MRNNQQNCATWRGTAAYRTNKQLISWPRIALPVCRECRHSTAVAEDAAVQNKGYYQAGRFSPPAVSHRHQWGIFQATL
jgi:hypothetical protein